MPDLEQSKETAPSFPCSTLCRYLSTQISCLKLIIVDKGSGLGRVFPGMAIFFHSQNASIGKPADSLFPAGSDILSIESEAWTCSGMMKRTLPAGIN